MKDVVEASHRNWEKMAELAEKIQKMHQESMGFKDKVKSTLAEYSKDISKRVIGQIQNAKVGLATHENKLKDIKAKQQ